MSDLSAASDITFFQAILYCFYPIGTLVLIELVLRAVNDDDDDGGKGIRIRSQEMTPAYAPSGA